MEKDDSTKLGLPEELEPVDPEAIAEFERAMDEVIPKIAEAVEERRMLAVESRMRQLKWTLKREAISPSV
jgi:hypothetical protein